MGNGKSGLRNSECEDCEAPKIVELGIRNFPNSAIRISSIPNSAFRNPQSAIPSPLRNSEWEDCEAPKIVELGIRNFPNSAIRISSISPSPIPQSAIRNSFVGLSPALQRRRHPTNGYFCKGVRSAIVTVEYGDTGRFPASRRRAGVWTFQHLSRWRCRRIPRSKSRALASGECRRA